MSSFKTLTIDPISVGGIVSADQTNLQRLFTNDLLLSGETGSVVKWQKSTVSDFSSAVTDIASIQQHLTGLSIGPLTTTTYFRAVCRVVLVQQRTLDRCDHNSASFYWRICLLSNQTICTEALLPIFY